MRIFFAGPLTTLTDPDGVKEWYKSMAEIATKNGFDCFWAFLSGTDPVENPDVKPDYIYKKDLEELNASDIMIAYIGEPSTGTGQEIEFAKEHNIPVYLIYEKDRPVSRMVLGNPAVRGVIEFSDYTDSLTQLDSLLSSIKEKSTS